VLDGVRDLLSERWAEDAVLVGALREWLWADGLLRSKLVEGKDGNHPDAAKFRDYFDYDEPIRKVPSTARWRSSAAARRNGWTPSWCWTGSCSLASPRSRKGPLRCPWPKAASPAIWAGATSGAVPTSCSARPSPGPGGQAQLSLERDLFTRLREDAEAWPSRSSATTCATCCWPRRPASAW
jgi:uncharacterized protein